MSDGSRRKIPPHQEARATVGANLSRLMERSADLKTSRQVEAKSRELISGAGIERRQFERIVKGEIGTSLDTLGFLADLFGVEPHELLIQRKEMVRGSISKYERNVKYSPDFAMQSAGQKAKRKYRS